MADAALQRIARSGHLDKMARSGDRPHSKPKRAAWPKKAPIATAELDTALKLLAENPPQLAIAQHSVRLALEDVFGELKRSRIVKQGDNALSIYYRIRSSTGAPTPHPSILAADAWLDETSK